MRGKGITAHLSRGLSRGYFPVFVQVTGHTALPRLPPEVEDRAGSPGGRLLVLVNLPGEDQLAEQKVDVGAALVPVIVIRPESVGSQVSRLRVSA